MKVIQYEKQRVGGLLFIMTGLKNFIHLFCFFGFVVVSYDPDLWQLYIWAYGGKKSEQPTFSVHLLDKIWGNVVYFIKFFLFLNDYLNTDNSTHDRLEERVLPT